MILDGAETGNIDKNLSKEELENYLKRADKDGKGNFQFCQKILCQSFIPTDENLASYRGNSDS